MKDYKPLNQQDLHSATWEKLSIYLDDRLAMLREQNDTPKDEAKTNLLRGRIAEIKHFMSLAETGGDEENEPDDLDY